VRRAAAAKVERLLSQKDRKELYRILDRLDEALSALNEEGDPEDVWDEPDARAQATTGSRRD